MNDDALATTRRRALAVIGAFALARFALMLSLGLGRDETYTVVVSRRLALSYFDHPPLHQWIAHFAALAFGETVWVRLPFVVLFAATGWLMFELTQRLFGARAGLIALVALNVTPFFFSSGGGWVVPDGTLLFALAAAALALSRLLFEPADRRAAWGLWLCVGFFLGLAGLSKYSAGLTLFGLLGYLVASPRNRRWLADPAPYVAALLGAAMVAPVFVWNARHGWASFAFQFGRGGPSLDGAPKQVLGMALGEIAYLSPWIFVPLAAALIEAVRAPGRADERKVFLACLALPPILVFTITPLWGARGNPHWTMPGWFFAYPLLGAWLDDAARRQSWVARIDLRRAAIGASAALGVIALFVASQADTGWIEKLAGTPPGVSDPTLETLAWSPLAKAPAILAHPDFVVTIKWSEGGKVAYALGPDVPVFVFSIDPRGMAFLSDSARFVGKDAVIVVARDHVGLATPYLKDFFTRLDPPQYLSFGRGGRDEVELALIPAHGLTRAFPVPYPL